MILYLETGTFEIPDWVVHKIDPDDVKGMAEKPEDKLACICFDHKGKSE